MANTFDVAARLAEARPTIDDVEEYVAACRRLGYQHRDLTMHSMQVHDWYAGEEGLDLRALDVDHRALAAAAAAAEDAARMQTGLVAELDAAWAGRGAAAAREFMWRSCQSATAVSAAVSAAADAVATLRDALWQAVDAKVRATETIDGKQQPHRAEWLAAATTVTTGAGDVAAASELIDLQVKPFVEVDVGADWLPAMRNAISTIEAAYDTAIAGATARVAVFGVPGVLGPRPDPSRHEVSADDAGAGPVPSSATVLTIPASATGSAPASAVPSLAPAIAAPAPAPWSSPEPVALPPAAAPLAPPPAASSMPSMPSMPSSGDLGTGTSSIGSGLAGFGQQLADLIGGLIGSADGLPESPGVDEPAGPDGGPGPPENTEKPDKPEKAEETAAEEEVTAAVDPAEPAPEPRPESEPAPAPPPDPAPTPTRAPTSTPLPSEPPPVPQGVPEAVAQNLAEEEPTPCEIAVDELPQVGE